MSALLASAEELALMGGWEMDLDTRHARWTDGMYRIHGLPPQSVEPGVEMLLELVHPDDRDRVRALLESVGERPDLVGPEGIVDEYRARLADGSVRHVRFLGRIERDERTGRRRWIGSGQDVTAELLTERELQAHYAVSQALREWESFDEGVVDLLRRMATALEYPMASLWLWDKSIEASALPRSLARSGPRPGRVRARDALGGVLAGRGQAGTRLAAPGAGDHDRRSRPIRRSGRATPRSRSVSSPRSRFPRSDPTARSRCCRCTRSRSGCRARA